MGSNLNSQNNTAVLLISHGSSLPYAEKTFNEICRSYTEATGHCTEVGYMKVAEPSIPKAIDNLVSRNSNINKIIAMPVFLAEGIHTNIDIPLILGLEPKETDPRFPDGNYPEGFYLSNLEDINFDGEINLVNCIGPDPLIVEIINKRVNSTIKKSKVNTSSEKTGILLISHGSRLRYNYDFITNIFNQYKLNTDYIVGQGFMELMEPSIPQSINSLVQDNDLDRLIAVPVFLAPGVHTTHDIPSILGISNEDNGNSHSHNHSHSHHHKDEINFEGEILYTEPLGADSLIIDIIKDRIKNELH